MASLQAHMRGIQHHRSSPPRSFNTQLPCRRAVLVRAEREGKVLREFREQDDGSLVEVEQKASASSSQPLYADDAMRMAPKKKDNMSKEMKERLRREYTGLGGAENTLRFSRRLPIVAVASVEERPTQVASVATVQEAVPSTTQSKVRSSKWQIDENEVLASTWEHRAWTFGSMAVMLATALQGLSAATGPADYSASALALAAAFLLADLGTGIAHWGLDNYGDANTPLFGRQIAAFQGHHQRPWTITQRQFCNNVHQVFKPALGPSLFFLLISPWTPTSFDVFISTFTFFVCMSQQFHAWSHMKKSELPSAVVALQDAGLLISRRAHGMHHRAPFDCQYCIVSGIWNDVLDNTAFFNKLERLVQSMTGVEPRSWHDTQEDWLEQERPTTI